ncbi:MAG: NAD(P)H-hydrate dehydratase [Opitutus sp.]
MIPESHPILSCEAAAALEQELFAGDEEKEWVAMQRAGQAIGAAIMADALEIGGLAAESRLLVLVGKGHNGGDAMIAAQTILRERPRACAELMFVLGERSLRPLAMRARRELTHAFGGRVRVVALRQLGEQYDLCLDGVFGFKFRPPIQPAVQDVFDRVNRIPISLRAAVDLPSGGRFKADFTYATGAVKADALETALTGRLRYLDLGFFRGVVAGNRRGLTAGILAPLAALRSPRSDKRDYGHLFVMGGSRSYPGAVLMSVMAALRSGVGLLTAFVPESLAAAYAARLPEAMWVGCPETPDGGLALEGLHLMRARMERASAWVVGPGLGREPETLALVSTLGKISGAPVLLDADALQSVVIDASRAPLVLTPHAGEFERISGTLSLNEFTAKTGAVVVKKGPVTEIAGGGSSISGEPSECDVTYASFFGGPVLARGGSGDLLAGLIGGLLAQTPADRLLAAARGAVWHGLAADLLARSHGQVAVKTTQLVEFLPVVLRQLGRT